MEKSKNLKLIKKEDFGNSQYFEFARETQITQHYFTLEQKDGYVLKAKIYKVVTDQGNTYYRVWSLKGSSFPYDANNFKTYDELIEMYSIWADDIENDTLMGQTRIGQTI
jgi:hypothetical protein